LCRRQNSDRPHLVGDHGSDRLDLGKQLEPRLRLARLGRLGAEAVDESLHVLALRFLFLGKFQVERLPLAALALERGIAAAIERKFASLQMQDPVDRVIEEITVDWILHLEAGKLALY